MSWVRQYRENIVHVPQDDRERMALLVDAETRLAETQNLGAEVTDVSISLRERNDRNHFAQGLQRAFGVAGK